MKTTKEMIEVMQAYERGEQIQILDINGIWEDKEYPYWNWTQCDYRVKPKTKYVPFDTAEEFLEAQREHGDGLISIDDNGVVKAHDISISPYGSVYEHGENQWTSTCEYIGDLKDLFEYFKMADGTPCGKEVEVCQI